MREPQPSKPKDQGENNLDVRDESMDAELAQYKIPPGIEVNETEKSVSLKSNAGAFHMPLEMFKLYIQKFTISPDHFPYIIASYVRESEYDRDPTTIEIKRKIRELLESKGLRPADYLGKYGDRNEKTAELMGILPKEIVDEIMFERLQYHFRSNSANDSYNYFEHISMAGSSTQFFGRPFVGGFKVDAEWQGKIRAKREEFLKTKNNISTQALILFTNRNEYDYGNISHDFKHTEAGSQELSAQVRSRLKLLYESAGEPVVPFEQVDYARVVLKPVSYNENMEAIPAPQRLEFLHEKKVVMTIDTPELLEELRPAQQDFRLADVLEDAKGEKHYVEVKTEGFEHMFSFSDKEIPDWYNSYLQRISRT